MPLPDFRNDGYLPEGVHQATEAEVLFRFGSSNRRRRSFALRLRRWLELARSVQSLRFLVDGSFVTSKPDPADIDAVVLLPMDFERRVQAQQEQANELHEILTTRRQEHLFAACNDTDWVAWIEFFTRTREADARRKGVVEILL